jgi:hypothetical protein
MYWVKPSQPLSTKHGMHRFVWDLHHTPPVPGPVSRRGGSSVYTLPGQYQLKLTVETKGQTLASATQPLTVVMDPRIKVSEADLRAQHDASLAAGAQLRKIATFTASAAEIEKQLNAYEKTTTGGTLQALQQFHHKFTAIAGPAPQGYGRPVVPLETDHSSIRYLAGDLRRILGALQSADAAPTPEQLQALNNDTVLVNKAAAQWNTLLTADLPVLNAQLKSAGVAEIKTLKPELPPESDDEDR